MTPEELIRWLKMTDFTKNFPVIEGEYFFTPEDLLAWFEREVSDKDMDIKSSLWWKCERCGKLIPYMADFCHECAYELLGDPPKPFEPQKGEWIEGDTDVYYDLPDYKCSLCGYISLENGKYCPNCGKKMIETQESEDK